MFNAQTKKLFRRLERSPRYVMADCWGDTQDMKHLRKQLLLRLSLQCLAGRRSAVFVKGTVK